MSVMMIGVIISSVQIVEIMADYEQVCDLSDVNNGGQTQDRYVSCGDMLTSLVFSICDGNVYVDSFQRKKRTAPRKNVFYDTQVANTFLRRERDVNEGIVCECCINHCSLVELSQYCATPTRRKRSVTTTKSNKVSVKQFLHKKDNIAAPHSMESFLSSPSNRKIAILERNKRLNIEQKHYSKLLHELDAPVNSAAKADNENVRHKGRSALSLGELIANSLRHHHPVRHHPEVTA